MHPVDAAPQTVARPATSPRQGRGHAGRLGVLVALSGTLVAIRLLRSWLWRGGTVPVGPVSHVLSYGAVLWAVPALSCLLSVAGMLLYGSIRRASYAPGTDVPDDPPFLVCFRIVSRGENVGALRATVASVRREMAEQPLFAYRVEVVTDCPVSLRGGPDLRLLVVPPGYRTPTGARFKARALQYAIERSDLAAEAWIFHLDEESHLSPSVVAGIRDAVAEEERTGAHRIGQGVILYHRDLARHPVLTLADMVRTGDDVGRFYLQHRLGVSIIGLHGSFVLVRNDVEQKVGFDLGPEGSITEDAFWALRQMEKGSRCRWVEGYIVEQSPHSVRDFLKQRRRWLAGMTRVILYAEVQAWIRLPLALFTLAWSSAWLGMAYTVLNAFTGWRTAPGLSLLGDVCLAVFTVTYLVGLTVNLRDVPDLGGLRRGAIFVLTVVLIPFFAVLESAGVLYAIVRPERGFHVVDK